MLTSIRNVEVIKWKFLICWLPLFVLIIFLIKLRWPKTKSLYKWFVSFYSSEKYRSYSKLISCKSIDLSRKLKLLDIIWCLICWVFFLVFFCVLIHMFVLLAELRRPARQAEPHKHPIYGKQKETHELIFSWLSWLAVLLVGAYARRRRRRRSRATSATWRPYSK